MRRRAEQAQVLEIHVSHVGGRPRPLLLHLLPLLRGPPPEAPPQPLSKGSLHHLAAALQHSLAGDRRTADRPQRKLSGGTRFGYSPHRSGTVPPEGPRGAGARLGRPSRAPAGHSSTTPPPPGTAALPENGSRRRTWRPGCRCGGAAWTDARASSCLLAPPERPESGAGSPGGSPPPCPSAARRGSRAPCPDKGHRGRGGA